MQALFSAPGITLQNESYTHGMPRPRTKARLAQGKRILELRKAAGLSQYELAEMLEVPQSNVAFGEQSEKPPRSDLLPKMVDLLGVDIVDILNKNGGACDGGTKQQATRQAAESLLRMSRGSGAVRRSILSESSPPSSAV